MYMLTQSLYISYTFDYVYLFKQLAAELEAKKEEILNQHKAEMVSSA